MNSDKPTLLIVTTGEDPSIVLLDEANISRLVEVNVVSYSLEKAAMDKVLTKAYDFVYLRDPFNDPALTQPIARQTTEEVIAKQQSAYFVDNIHSFEDMLFEDKWIQYTTFPELFPATRILNLLDEVNFEYEFVKKRISSRSKGVYFVKPNFASEEKPPDYIVQQKLKIDIEYRVFMVGSTIITPLAIKSSKSKGQKVKVIGLNQQIPDEIFTICNQVYEKTNYDFMGLDIAKTDDGYYLLEINRSCQFVGYKRVSSINLAEKLVSQLIS